MPLAHAIDFDAATHTYRVAGIVRPSVTQILHPIHNFDHVDPDVLERARQFGTHVHAATDLFDRGILDEDNLDLPLVPYLEAYKTFLLETGFVVTHSEERVYNPRQKYCGTLDRRGTWKGSTWLLDFKSGAVPRSVGLQTAGYQMSLDPGERPKRRLCLQLKRNSYRLIKCEESSDWSYFVGFLNVHRFMHREVHQAEAEAA